MQRTWLCKTRVEWGRAWGRAGGFTDLLVIKVCAADKTEGHENHNHLQGREGSMCDRGWDLGKAASDKLHYSVQASILNWFCVSKCIRITLLAVFCVIFHYCDCFHAIVETNFGNEAGRIIVNPWDCLLKGHIPQIQALGDRANLWTHSAKLILTLWR